MATNTKTTNAPDHGVSPIDLVEDAASRMINANAVEEGWFLRGVADGLAGLSADTKGAGLYAKAYGKGYRAATDL